MRVSRGGPLRTTVATGVIVGIATLGCAGPAAAAPTTEVIQGQVLRLVSVADWSAASSMRPGERVGWDVAVSSDAPEPGTVRIGISARGGADLLVDAQVCMRAWEGAECPGGARALRSDWSLPLDGIEVPLLEMAEGDVAHLRFSIALDGAHSGSTEVRVHAEGAGESAVIGPDGGLATTGPSTDLRWALAAGGVLLVSGATSTLVRRRRGPSHASGGGS